MREKMKRKPEENHYHIKDDDEDTINVSRLALSDAAFEVRLRCEGRRTID
uniref:Uncharacterized protein n=1 Tax=Nelumbo nucifera TaxID=4432 RepID=A0A822XKN8_NELNU|nr:TPA_asm: hypothetical protein HUJ06_020979 [Nelumbo nucifera]